MIDMDLLLPHGLLYRSSGLVTTELQSWVDIFRKNEKVSSSRLLYTMLLG